MIVRNGLPPLHRQGNEINIKGRIVEKTLSQSELKNYEFLERHRKFLYNGDKTPIIFPVVEHFDPESCIIQLTRLEYFRVANVFEHFGLYTIDGNIEEYANTLMHAIKKINLLPSTEYIYSADEEQLSNLLTWLSAQSYQIDSAYNLPWSRVENTLRATQKATERVTCENLVISHRDPTPGNFRTVRIKDQLFTLMLDLETFGLAPIGFDQARIYTFHSLDPVKQEAILTSFKAIFKPSQDELLFFWRTVLVRTYRELSLILSGKYKEFIDQTISIYPDLADIQLGDSLTRTASIAIENISKLNEV